MLAVIADVRKEEKERQQQHEFQNLASDMLKLLEKASEPDHAGSGDFVLVCEGGEELRCHRLILMARCPTLAQGITIPMNEAVDGRWRVNNEDGPADPAVVKNLLTFIYTGRFKEERMGELLELAHMNMLPTLAQICRERITQAVKPDNALKAVKPDNALKTLAYTERFTQDEEQKKKYRVEMLQFIKKHKWEITQMDDWPAFQNKDPDLVTEIVLTD